MMRVVLTGVPATKQNVDMFRSVFGQLSDGIWENSSRCVPYWTCANIGSVDTDSGSILTINVVEDYYGRAFGELVTNPYFKMHEVQILKYFITKLRQIVYAEAKDDRLHSYKITAGNSTVCRYLSYDANVTAGDVATAIRQMHTACVHYGATVEELK